MATENAHDQHDPSRTQTSREARWEGDDGGRMRRIVGGRASRLEVYGLAILLFLVTAGGISGAMVIATTTNDQVAAPTSVVAAPTTSVDATVPPSTDTTAPPVTTPVPTSIVVVGPPPTDAPPTTTAPAPAAPKFTDAELAALQQQAQKALAEKAAHDAYIRSISVDGCPPGPYVQTLVGWNGGRIDDAMTITGVRSGDMNYLGLGAEIAHVAGLGCVVVNVVAQTQPDGSWNVYWFNVGLVTQEQVRQAMRNRGYY